MSSVEKNEKELNPSLPSSVHPDFCSTYTVVLILQDYLFPIIHLDCTMILWDSWKTKIMNSCNLVLWYYGSPSQGIGLSNGRLLRKLVVMGLAMPKKVAFYEWLRD